MCEERRTIVLAGIGPGSEKLTVPLVRDAVQKSDCLIGAGRMIQWAHGLMENSGREVMVFVEYDPQRIVDLIRKNPQYRKITVLLSGDTGFYSGAKKLSEFLCRELKEETEIQFLPGISSAAMLAAKLGTSWEDAVLLSMHGRETDIAGTISRNRKTILLLGGENTGKFLLDRLKDYGLGRVFISGARRLSYPDEEIFSGLAEELDVNLLSGLCTVMIINPFYDRKAGPHVADEAFIRGKVPMTKEEVRCISIAKLRLTHGAVMYDIGAGTGSVSVEAALCGGAIRVYAVEQNKEALELIRQNRRKFCTDTVHIVEGKAPEVLMPLETPTHAFIGGSGGKLKEILSLLHEKNPKIRIVINAISMETLCEVMEAVKEGLLPEPEITQVMIAHSRSLGAYHMMMGQNPVYIISAGGEEEHE